MAHRSIREKENNNNNLSTVSPTYNPTIRASN